MPGLPKSHLLMDKPHNPEKGVAPEPGDGVLAPTVTEVRGQRERLGARVCACVCVCMHVCMCSSAQAFTRSLSHSCRVGRDESFGLQPLLSCDLRPDPGST